MGDGGGDGRRAGTPAVDDERAHALRQEAAAAARPHLALALDIDDLVPAVRTARQLRPWFRVAKVGLELFAAAGPDAVTALVDLGYDVFLDLKLHDIPTTVGRAARVVGSYGTSYLTLHAAGGAAMLRAGVEGLAEGAAGAGVAVPTALGVTVLTSDADAPPATMAARVAAGLEAGCGGFVCATSDVGPVRALAPDAALVVPGIRLDGPAHDQARVGRPEVALADGADLLVIGRAVTAAPDPRRAAEAVAAAVAGVVVAAAGAAGTAQGAGSTSVR